MNELIIIVHPQGEQFKIWLQTTGYTAMALRDMVQLAQTLEGMDALPDLIIVDQEEGFDFALEVAHYGVKVCILSSQPRCYSQSGVSSYLTPVAAAQLQQIVAEMLNLQ